MPHRPHRRATGRCSSRLSAGAAALVLTLGTLVASLGEPALLVATALTFVVAWHARTIGWRLATAGAVLIGLTCQLYLATLSPHLGVSLELASIASWSLVGLVHLVLLVRDGWPRLSSGQLRTLVLALVVPVCGLVGYAALILRRPHGPLATWAMHADWPSNALFSINAWEDNGIILGRRQVTPLTSVLNSVWAAGDLRGLERPADVGRITETMVRHCFQVEILEWLLISFIIGTLCHRSVAGSRRLWVSGLAVPLVALLPWTWFFTINSLRLGAQNVAPSILLLLLSWTVWLYRGRHVSAAITILIMGSVAVVASWLPLVIVPGAFLVSLVVTRRRLLAALPWRRHLPAVLALASAFAYAVGYTLPQERQEGAANILARDGAVIDLSAAGAVLATVAFVSAAFVMRRVVHPFWTGLLVTLPPAVAMMAYLLYVRRDRPFLWGYYPIKFAWFLIALTLLVTVALAVRSVTMRWTGAGGLVGGVAVVAVAVAGLAMIATPRNDNPTHYAFTPVAIARDHGHDRITSTMFGLLDSHPHTIALELPVPKDYVGLDDAFIDYWAIQMNAWHVPDPVRSYAFRRPDAATVCGVVRVWGPDSVVLTTSRAAARALKASCSAPYRLRRLSVPRYLGLGGE